MLIAVQWTFAVLLAALFLLLFLWTGARLISVAFFTAKMEFEIKRMQLTHAFRHTTQSMTRKGAIR